LRLSASQPRSPAIPDPDDLVHALLLARACCAGEPYGVAVGGSQVRRLV